MQKLMILPAQDATKIRLIKLPDDYEEHEVYRHVVGIISQVEEADADYDWDDIETALEEHDMYPVEFILGPHLD